MGAMDLPRDHGKYGLLFAVRQCPGCHVVYRVSRSILAGSQNCSQSGASDRHNQDSEDSFLPVNDAVANILARAALEVPDRSFII